LDALFDVGRDIPAPKPARVELDALGRELYKEQVPQGGYESEGFAEFVRLWASDPGQATAKAPETAKWWESEVVAKNKALADALAPVRETALALFPVPTSSALSLTS
jgi:hypothetical protein